MVGSDLSFPFVFAAIEEEYNGPALEDGKVTLKFVTDLMETYKNQGKLHRKYAYKVSFEAHFNHCYSKSYCRVLY